MVYIFAILDLHGDDGNVFLYN